VALFVVTLCTGVEVEVADAVLPAITEVPFEPVRPVGAAPDPVVAEVPPIPTPWEGERPPPEEATPVAEAAVEREEAALETEPEAEDSEDPDEVVADGEAAPEEVVPDPEITELDATGADEDDEGVEETSLQERSNNGVVLKVEPTIPKLGEGTDGSASWRVNQ